MSGRQMMNELTTLQSTASKGSKPKESQPEGSQPEYKPVIEENYIPTLSPTEVKDKVTQVITALAAIQQLKEGLNDRDGEAMKEFNKRLSDIAQTLDFITPIALDEKTKKNIRSYVHLVGGVQTLKAYSAAFRFEGTDPKICDKLQSVIPFSSQPFRIFSDSKNIKLPTETVKGSVFAVEEPHSPKTS